MSQEFKDNYPDGQPEIDAPKPTKKAAKDTEDSQAAHTEAMNNPDTSVQKVPTDEIPAHLAPQQHAPYAEKPIVQLQNETLTNATPTGYAPHEDEKPKKSKG